MEEENEEIKGNKWDKFKEKIKENPWQVTTVILGLASVILLVLALSPNLTGNVISGSSAGDKLVEYLNARVGGGVEYISNEDLGNIYEITVAYQGQELPVYVTKDGKYFVQGISPLTGEIISDIETQPQQPQDIPKSDKPKVELFVMTHCPYGTQAEKGIIPVIKALSNNIDTKIRFVHYFIHGDKEEKETYNQVCIREEQSQKYLDYLSCFLEDGDSERCLSKIGIDKNKLNSCLAGKAKDYYAKDSELSQQYGVQGSPTLIINGQEVSSGRSSQAFLDTICKSFNTEPSQCSQTLSTANPSAGFGYSVSTTGTGNDAQC